jgi:long-subunit fatty acid transport protein
LPRLLLATTALGALLAGSAPALAGNGLSLLHQGAKASGRGGAGTAVADDALSASRNPALLVQLDGDRIDLTLAILATRSRERSATEDVFDEKVFLDPIPMISYSTDAFAFEGDPEEDGLGDYRPSSGPFVAFSLFQPVVGVLAPTISLAFRVTDTLALGFSVNVLMTYLALEGSAGGVGGSSESSFVPGGRVQIYYQPDGTPVSPPQAFDAGTGQQVTWAEIFDMADSGVAAPDDEDDGEEDDNDGIQYKLEDVFGVGIAAQVGLLWTPRHDLSIGVGIRSPGIIFEPSGSAELDLGPAIEELQQDPDVGVLIGSLIDTYLPDRGANGYKTELDVSTDKLVLPAEISLGIAWWPVPRWLLSLDVRWIGWHEAFDEIELVGKGSTNRDLNEINGGSTLKYTFRLDWEDQLVIALGTTVAVSDWLLLRAGFNHGESPAPASTSMPQTFAIEHHVTAGASFRVGGWDLDLSYIYGLPAEVRQEESTFKVEEHQLLIGAGYRF